MSDPKRSHVEPSDSLADEDGIERAHAGTQELVARAQRGDAGALEQLVRGVQDSVYRLALRMVTRPSEAEDATQEIIIRVMTRLSTFRGEALFSTWVHRVAVNHLLDRAKSAVETMELTFDMYAEDLRGGLSAAVLPPESGLLVEEVKLACTQAMLTCLDRDHRVAYILGEIFQVTSTEGAYVCEVTPAAYRKRLSRARDRVRSFVAGNCGLVNPDNTVCRCERRVETAIRLGRIDPDRLEFASQGAAQGVEDMEALSDAASLMRSHPDYHVPHEVAGRITSLIHSGRYQLLDEA